MDRKILLRDDRSFGLSEEDVLEAMRSFGAYLDITPEDFRAVYTSAFGIARRRFLEGVTAANIMSAPVLTMSSAMSLRDAVDFLDEHNISGAPVEDGRRLVGVLSETDIARAADGAFRPSPMHLLRSVLRENFSPTCLNRTVAEVMTREVITVRPDTSLAEMLAVVKARNINRLPVLNPEGRLAGLVSRPALPNTLGSPQ